MHEVDDKAAEIPERLPGNAVDGAPIAGRQDAREVLVQVAAVPREERIADVGHAGRNEVGGSQRQRAHHEDGEPEQPVDDAPEVVAPEARL